MKAKFKTFTALACAALCALPLAACNAANKDTGKSALLGKPAAVTSVSYEETQGGQYKKFKSGVENFAATFSEYAYADYDKDANFAVSPVSVYMALSLASECAAGETRNEILNALGVSYSQLTENFPLLYRSLFFERKSGGKISSMLNPTNSVWVNDGTQVNTSCIDALSEYYYCYSYSADFKNDNAGANKAIRNFVKEQTRGLIDKDFNLSERTLFTLINTLYLKTIWNDGGDDLLLTPQNYGFKNADGTVKNTKLLSGYYNEGRVYEDETFSSFYTSTYDGIKIKFILPKDGYSVKDVFTAENIAKANSAVYETRDENKHIIYKTRCLFPEYKCGYDEDIKDILMNNYGIDKFFKDPGKFSDACDFSNLSEEPCFCSTVKHVTDLTVDKKGIEGAAATVIGMDEATAVPPVYEYVCEDFVVDKAFGFVMTDYDGVTLFSGVVKSI